MPEIRESDWKVLRRLKPVALDRFCQRALTNVQITCYDTSVAAHERYLKVFRLVEQEDKRIAEIFDDLRRSNAVFRLTLMRTAGLITDDEFAEFSQELRDVVQGIQSI